MCVIPAQFCIGQIYSSMGKMLLLQSSVLIHVIVLNLPNGSLTTIEQQVIHSEDGRWFS